MITVKGPARRVNTTNQTTGETKPKLVVGEQGALWCSIPKGIETPQSGMMEVTCSEFKTPPDEQNPKGRTVLVVQSAKLI